jgi:hypothetical protein
MKLAVKGNGPPLGDYPERAILSADSGGPPLRAALLGAAALVGVIGAVWTLWRRRRPSA